MEDQEETVVRECALDGCTNKLEPADYECCWDHKFLDGEYMVHYYMSQSPGHYFGD